jgi:hypothetical protein
MPGKKFVQPLRQRKKIRASKQLSTNSLEKKFVQRLNALKKILQRHETEKKIRAAKILYPPSRDFQWSAPNDAKWPHTRQIKIAGRNHILPPLGIAWKTKHRQFPRGN